MAARSRMNLRFSQLVHSRSFAVTYGQLMGLRIQSVAMGLMVIGLILLAQPEKTFAATTRSPVDSEVQKTSNHLLVDSAVKTRRQRIVSLNPSLTAILLAIGAQDQIVGIDSYSASQQSSLFGLPTVGGLFSTSFERVVSLEPSLVVTVPSANQRDFYTQLEQLGISLLVFDPINFEDVLETIQVLGEKTGHGEEARARVSKIRAAQKKVQGLEKTALPPRTVIVLQRDPLFIVGRGSFIDDMLGMIQANNLGAEFDQPYPRVSLEWLVSVSPDILLDASDDSMSAIEYWSRWSSLSAVQNGNVSSLLRKVVTMPGPHLDQALYTLWEAVHHSSPTQKPLK